MCKVIDWFLALNILLSQALDMIWLEETKYKNIDNADCLNIQDADRQTDQLINRSTDGLMGGWIGGQRDTFDFRSVQ